VNVIPVGSTTGLDQLLDSVKLLSNHYSPNNAIDGQLTACKTCESREVLPPFLSPLQMLLRVLKLEESILNCVPGTSEFQTDSLYNEVTKVLLYANTVSTSPAALPGQPVSQQQVVIVMMIHTA
jgi:hypothetical protein